MTTESRDFLRDFQQLCSKSSFFSIQTEFGLAMFWDSWSYVRFLTKMEQGCFWQNKAAPKIFSQFSVLLWKHGSKQNQIQVLYLQNKGITQDQYFAEKPNFYLYESVFAFRNNEIFSNKSTLRFRIILVSVKTI